jgi:hypothetical protein
MRKAPPASAGGRFSRSRRAGSTRTEYPSPARSRSFRRTRPGPRQPPQPLPPAVRGSGGRDSTNDCGLRGLGPRGSRAVTAGTAGETAGRAAGGNRGRRADGAGVVVNATLGGAPASGFRIRYLCGCQRVTRRRAPAAFAGFATPAVANATTAVFRPVDRRVEYRAVAAAQRPSRRFPAVHAPDPRSPRSPRSPPSPGLNAPVALTERHEGAGAEPATWRLPVGGCRAGCSRTVRRSVGTGPSRRTARRSHDPRRGTRPFPSPSCRVR